MLFERRTVWRQIGSKFWGRPKLRGKKRVSALNRPDAKTAQLRRERWEFVGIHPALPQPVTLIRLEAAYAESRFGILVPERVVFEWGEHTNQRKEKDQPPNFLSRCPRDLHLQGIPAIRGRDATNDRNAGVASAVKPGFIGAHQSVAIASSTITCD